LQEPTLSAVYSRCGQISWESAQMYGHRRGQTTPMTLFAVWPWTSSVPF